MLRSLALLSLLCIASVSAADMTPDAPQSEWQSLYDRALDHVVARRLLVGYADLTYKPTQIATRYEWAAVLSRLAWYFDLELPEREYLPPDVPWDHWCADACRVLTASRLYPAPHGVRFAGEKALTRGDFALMTWNLVQALRGVIPPKRLSDLDDPCGQAARLLIEQDLFAPCADGELHLEAPMPRGQVCVAVRELLIWNEKQRGPQLWGPVMYVPNRGGRRPQWR